MNADPRILYVVATTVAACVLAWVAFVLLRAPKR
jgi:hypothetical protein